MPLEPRIMFDGSAAHAALGAASKALIPAVPGPVEVHAASPARNGGRTEVAFVDTSVPDWQALVAGLEKSSLGVEVELIDGGQRGLAQIATWADAHSGYDAIHILSQGGDASFTIGTDRITNTALGNPVVEAELGEIGSALKAGGELALYGSDIAAGSEGQHLLAGLAADTGAVVVASDHAVGSAGSGADWTLDVATGFATVSPLAIPGYLGTLSSGAQVTDTAPAPVEAQAADPSIDGGLREVAFVDTSVAGWETLVTGIQSSRPGMEIELIDGTQGGLAQMASWAASHTGYNAIHVLSHAAEAELYLGTDLLTDSTLSAAATRTELAGIGAALKPNGDLLLYGCDTGENNDGDQFLTDLAADTGANVAGSTHLVGAAALGGDWALDRQTGPIDVASLAVTGYDNVLAVFGSPTSSFTIQTATSAYYFEQAVGTPNNGVDVLLRAVTGPQYIKSYTSSGVLNWTVEVNTLTGVTIPSTNQVNILAASNGDLVFQYNNDDSGDGGSNNAYFVVLNSSGTEITARTQINTTTGNSQTRNVFMAQLNNGNIAFAYQESDDSNVGVRIFGLNGTAIIAEEEITGGVQNGFANAVAASSSGGFIVAYYDRVYSGQTDNAHSGFSIYDNSGNLQTNVITQTEVNPGNPPLDYVIALSNGDYLFETSFNSSVAATIYSPAGVVVVASAAVGGAFGPGYITPVDTPSDPGYATWNYDSTFQADFSGSANYTDVPAHLMMTRYSNSGVVSGAATSVDSSLASGIYTNSQNYSSDYPGYFIYSGYSQGVIEIRELNTDSTVNNNSSNTWAIGANLFEMSSGPSISSAAYDPSTGNLTLSGGSLTTSTGDYTVGDFTLTGASSGTYTLGNGDTVSSASATSVVIHIATANQATVDGLLNAAGTHAASNGTTYNLAALASWDTAATAAATNAVTVTDSGTPTLSHSGTTAPDATTAGGSAVAIENGTVTATDSPDLSGAGVWSGGHLVVQIGATNHDSSHDELAVAAGGLITTSGSGAGETVSYNGHQIGIVATGDTGIPGQTLQINLSGSYATDAAMQALVNAITFNDSAATSAGDRTVTFTLTDGYGNSTTALSDTVHVVAGPSVSSIDRSIVATTPTNGTSESFIVTFSETVTGVAAADFTPAVTGTVSDTGVSVTGSGASYTVTVSGVAGDGTLGVNLSSVGSIKDGNNTALTATHTSDQTYTIDNTAPVIGNLNGDADIFVVGGSATLLDKTGTATVTETNIASGGVLTVSVVNDQSGEDVIGLKTAAGHITTSGASTVTVADNGTTIGSYTSSANGSAGANLVVTLAAGDTTTQVADLTHALTYNDTAGSPDLATRTLNVTLTDAAGNVSTTSALTVAFDHAPVVTAGHSLTIARTETGVALDNAIAVTDADGNWSGGTFAVQITANADATHDSLALPSASNAGIWLSGTALMYGSSTQIGTASAASVAGGIAWTFTLNANATNISVAALAEAIQLAVSTGGSLATRTVSFTATDGDAVAGTLGTDSVTVVAQPSITGGTSHSISDSAIASPLSGVTITDAANEGVTVSVAFNATYGDFSNTSGWTAGTVGSTRSYTKDFASAALANTALGSLSFVPVAHGGNVGTTQTVTFSVTATGDITNLSTGADSASSAAVTYANTTPTITAGGGAVPTYAVGSTAIAIDSGLTVTDPDDGGVGNWSSGTLLVHIQTGDDTVHDQLSIASTGTATGISVSASVVDYNGVQIGTIHTGKTGSPGTDLQIDLNSSATDSAVQALAQAIQFGDSGQSNSSINRTVKFTVTDGASGTANVTDTVHVVLGPAVTTIDRHTGDPALTNAASVAFDVVFSEAVTGVGVADFTLTTTGTSTGTITSVSGSGTGWTVTVTGVSGNGTLRLDQTAAGSVIDGNSSALIGTHTGDQSFTIDTIAPNAPVIDATIIPDTGSSSTDRITSATTPTLHGTAEAGSTVTLYDTNGTTVLATAVADGSGDWSVATSTLGNGTHSITATAADQAGNVSVVSSPLSVTIDTHTPAAPVIAATIAPDTGSSNTDRITSATTPTLHGTAEAGDTVTLYDTNGTTVLATVVADGSGNWSVATNTLSSGTHSITATATDVAGTTSVVSTALSVTIDTHTPAAPTIAATIIPDTGSSSTDRITSASTPTLHGTAEAGDTVTLYDTNGTTVLATVIADGSGNWTVATSVLSDGTHSITATATDTAGTTSAIGTALSVTIDTHIPAAPVIAATITPDTGSSSTDRITSATTPTLHGTAEAGSTVTLYDTNGTTMLATVVADGSGNWSVATSTLGNGTHSITATATDVAGITSALSTALSVTIDTHTPAAPTIAATITPDTGSSSTDRITSATTPALHGTAEAGDTITLYDTNGTTVLGTTTADVNGDWSVATSTLTSGTHSITATATDAAGTTSAISTGLSVIIDPHTPAAPTIAATIAPDTGGSSTDRITSATTPTLHGTAEAGSTVTLYDTNGTTVLAIVVADGSGDWSIATSTLSNGSHSITATATDVAGTTSTASAALSVTIDTHTPAAPVIAATITPDTGSSSTDRITSATTPTLHGTAEAGDTITLYDTDGTTVLGTTTADGSGNWSVATSTLTNGTHSITATATDVAGTTSAISTGLFVTIDTHTPAAPTIATTITPDTGSSATDRITSATAPTLHGTAEAGSTVTLYDTNGTTTLATVVADGSGNWSVATSTLGNGTHSITATATDVAGTISSSSSALSVTIDTHTPAAPTIAATITPDTGSSSTDRITSATTPTLHGTAEAGSTVTLYDTDGTTVLATVAADGSGNWSVATNTLSNGTHSITATATDVAGTTSVASTAFSVTIDTHTPAAPFIAAAITPDTGSSSTDRITSATTPTLHGTAEAGDTVTLYDTNGTTVLATVIADGSGNWSVATSTLGNGTHGIAATATDVAGTTSAISTALSVTIDTHTPAAPTIATTITPDTGSSGTDRITSDNTPTLHGTAEAGSTVTVYDTNGTTVLATTTADANGNWSVATSVLPDGTHSITMTATDVAGTTSAVSAPLSVTIDTHTPAAPTIATTITPDTGSSSTDRITSATTPILHGTAEADDTIILYDTDGTTVLGTTTADVNGNWSVSTSTLGNGNHSITATATDTAGTTSAASAALFVTIDTHTPAAPVIAATITPDTGSSNTDRITNDNTPTLHGTAEAGDTITLYDTNGTSVLGTTIADANGDWSVATSVLSDGTHSITATATDTAGTTSAIGTALSVTIDTHTPVAPVIAATITPDTGSSSTDRITSATTPTLHGTAEPGSTVTLYDTNGTTVLATVVANGSGNWSVATSALPDGTHSITGTATDVAGTTSALSTALSVTIDTHAPTAPVIAVTITPDTGSSSTDRITSATTPTLHGTAEAGDTIIIYDTDGTTVLGTTTADVNGNWTVATSTLGNGTHSITATATDTAGTTSAIASALSVIIDTHTPAAPVIAATIAPDTGNSNTDRITSNNTPTLHGTAEAGSTVTLYDTNGTTVLATVIADGSGNWSVATSALPDGAHGITTTATDVAGITSTLSTALSVTIDTHTPAVPAIAATITPDTGNSDTDRITSATTPTLHGTAEAGDTITLYDTDGTTVLATTTADDSGNWSVATSTLSNGTHSITATATDVAGTASAVSAPLSVTIDTHTPAAPLIAGLTTATNTGMPGVTSDPAPTLTGTGEPGTTVTLYDGTTVIGTATVSSGGAWSLATPVLADGVHPLTATVTDTAGTVGAASASFALTIDTHIPTGPVITGLTAATGTGAPDVTSNRTPVVLGTAEPGSTVTLYDGTTELGTTTANSTGQWTFAVAAPLADGPHALTATATDSAATVGARSQPLTLSIAPTVSQTIPAQTWTGGSQNVLNLPLSVFAIPAGDRPVYQAKLVNADGSVAGPLPPWLSINPLTGALTGAVPLAATGTLHIQLTLVDENGDSASTVFDIHYQGPPAPQVAPTVTVQVPAPAPPPAMIPPAVQIVTVVHDIPPAPPNALPSFAPTVANMSVQPGPADAAPPPLLQTQALTVNAVPDSAPSANGAISYTIAIETPHTAGPETIHLSANLGDGAPLPSWLKFDPTSRTISGLPPPGTRPVVVVITATDNQGHSARTVVRLGKGETKPGRALDGTGSNARGLHGSLHGRTGKAAAALMNLRNASLRQGLTAQIRSAHRASQLVDQAATLRAAAQMFQRS